MSLTAEMIAGFSGSILSQRYDDPVPSPKVHTEWWNMCCSKHRLVAIAAPRNHAKTTAITHAYTLASMLFREAKFCLIVSDTEQQAIDFLGDIIIDLSVNDDLINLFGVAGFEKDTASAIVVRFTDGEKFKILAKGAGQKVRGIKWDQMRPDLIIIDDMENDENVNTKEQRLKLKKWINGALIPCMSNRGKLRAAGTIIHTDSWLASTMPDETALSTVRTPLRIYSKVPTKGWYSAKYRGHPGIGDYSRFLWPEHRDASFFKDEYARLEADGQTDVYSAEQLNEPIDETYSYFKKTDLRALPEASREVELNYYVGVDFAISKSERADFTVFAVVGVDEHGMLYLVDIVRGRFDPNESVSELFRLEKKYNPNMFFVEKGTLAHAMGAVLNKEMQLRQSYPQLVPISTTGDKRTKARGIQKVLRGNGMYVDKSAEWYPAFEDEMLRFDRGRNDDQVDAIALIGLKLDEILSARTQEDIAEDLYAEEFEDTQKQGANEFTGY